MRIALREPFRLQDRPSDTTSLKEVSHAPRTSLASVPGAFCLPSGRRRCLAGPPAALRRGKLHPRRRQRRCWNVYFIHDFTGEQFGEGQTAGQTRPEGVNAGSVIGVKPNRDQANDGPDDNIPVPMKVDPGSNVMPHEVCGHANGLGGGKKEDSDDRGVDHHHKSSDNLNHAAANGTKVSAAQCARIRSAKKLKDTDKKCECRPDTGGEKDKCPCR